MVKEKIQLYAKDGTRLTADYHAEKSKKGMVLLHAMPQDRSSWTAFAEYAGEKGYAAVALDLRGHGESQGGPRGYVQFSDEEHQSSILDVEAGDSFLRKEGADQIDIVGASIGANLALQYLSQNPQVRSAILLSPGLDYRGVRTKPFLENITAGQAIYFAAAEDDTDALDAARTLFSFCGCGKKQIKVFEKGGHGTEIFDTHPEFMEELLQWLD